MDRLKMFDCEDTELKRGDFVQLTKGQPPYISSIMKKGSIFRVAYCEDRSFSKDENPPFIVIFLKSKTGNRHYENGVTSKEIIKVNYDIKKKKIIQ